MLRERKLHGDARNTYDNVDENDKTQKSPPRARSEMPTCCCCFTVLVVLLLVALAHTVHGAFGEHATEPRRVVVDEESIVERRAALRMAQDAHAAREAAAAAMTATTTTTTATAKAPAMAAADGAAIRLHTNSSLFARNDSSLLFFIHIPKTGGQSFHTLLGRIASVMRQALHRAPLLALHRKAHGGAAADDAADAAAALDAQEEQTMDPARRRKLDLQHRRQRMAMLHHLRAARAAGSNESDAAIMQRLMAQQGGGSPVGHAPRLDLTFAQNTWVLSRCDNVTAVNLTFTAAQQFSLGHADVAVVRRVVAPRRVRFITILRQPAARATSLYYYLLTRLYGRGLKTPLLQRLVDVLGGDPRDAAAAADDAAALASYRARVDDEFAAVARAARHAMAHGAAATTTAVAADQLRISPWWRLVVNTSFPSWSHNTSLIGFVRSWRRDGLDNYQTRALSGHVRLPSKCVASLRSGAADDAAVDDARALSADDGARLLARARTELLAMPFFGLTEYFEASAALFRHTFNLSSSVTIPAATATAAAAADAHDDAAEALPAADTHIRLPNDVQRNRTPKLAHVHDDALVTRIVADINRFDVQLYDFAHAEFVRRYQKAFDGAMPERNKLVTPDATPTLAAAINE